MFNFIKEDSKHSSTRFTLLITTLSCCLLIWSMCFHIIWYTVYLQNIEWQSMSIFLAGVSALMGTVLYNKVKQKNIELTNNVKKY